MTTTTPTVIPTMTEAEKAEAFREYHAGHMRQTERLLRAMDGKLLFFTLLTCLNIVAGLMLAVAR